MDSTIVKLPEGFICPCCDVTLHYDAPVQNGGRPRAKGDIIICANCAMILVLDGDCLRKMTNKQFAALDGRTRAAVRLGCSAVRIAKSNQEDA
jgi:hypothetical protein